MEQRLRAALHVLRHEGSTADADLLLSYVVWPGEDFTPTRKEPAHERKIERSEVGETDIYSGLP